MPVVKCLRALVIHRLLIATLSKYWLQKGKYNALTVTQRYALAYIQNPLDDRQMYQFCVIFVANVDRNYDITAP
jgi:hypothetical protein